jgi:hypothetical protein
MNVLQLKSEGQFVQLLQEMLQKIGYTKIVADGKFGAQTDAAVKDFQNKNNLVIDGVVGPKTWTIIAEKSKPVIPTPQAESDIQKAAKKIGCEVAVIKAVNAVESGGRRGFLSNGELIILFEGHVFWRELKKLGLDPIQLSKGNKDILYQTWTKAHYKGGLLEHDRLKRAIQINKNAALASASWGKFQIMGNNFKACGFNNAQDFVNFNKQSEENQLLCFVEFVISMGLKDALKTKNWRAFARGYNGAGYEKNEYHIKLANAYKRYSS